MVNLPKYVLTTLIILLLIIPQIAVAGPFGGGDFIGTLFIVLAVTVIVFLIIREILCWYWKINTIVSLLEDIKGKLGTVGTALNNQSLQPTPVSSSGLASGAYKVKCKNCGEKTSSDAKFCEFCGSPMSA